MIAWWRRYWVLVVIGGVGVMAGAGLYVVWSFYDAVVGYLSWPFRSPE